MKSKFIKPSLLLVAFTALVSSNLQAASDDLVWDSSSRNPFPDLSQCTAYSWGRLYYKTGIKLEFTSKSNRHAGRFYELAVETPYLYRDKVPVRDGIVCWSKPGDYGHVGNVKEIKSNGGLTISHQNWPIGKGPVLKDLTASQVKRLPSTVNGKTTYFELQGFINVNRPTAIGTLSVGKVSNKVQAKFTLSDEDRREVNMLTAISENGQVVSGTSLSANIPANKSVTATFSNTSKLKKGRRYTLHVWATDFRGLKTSKSTNFTW